MKIQTQISWCRLVGKAFCFLFAFCLFGSALGQNLTYVGSQTIATGTLVSGVEIGGLSGISYNPYTDRFVAITDDSRTDGASRLWTLDLAYTGTAFTSATAISSIGLKKPDGSTLPLADTEGIAANLDGSFFVSHEGLAAGVDATYSIPPWIARFNGTTGNKEADVALPVKFLPRNSSGNQVPQDDATQTSGVRSNLSLECLGITPSKKVLFTSNEAALKQDYNGTYNSDTNQAQNSLTRIVRFTGAPGNPVAAEEKVYQADQGTLFIVVRRFNTVPEILPVDDSGRMFVMERGLTQNNTNLGSYRIRIYEVNFNQTGTTNVAGVNSLIGASYTRLSKTLRWESSSNMDNVESMCFGRDVNGFRTLVLASDNNFNGAQITQFHVFTTNIPAVTRRSLDTSSTGSGSVTASPSVAWYPDGSEVALAATPATSHTFANWTGSVTGSSNPVGLTMDANKSVTANFLSTVATLSNLALSSGSLSPAFASSTTSYTAVVANAVNALTVTPALTESAASVKVNGVAVASGSASGSIPLSVGSNTLTVLVTAQDGTTTKTYTVTVTRRLNYDYWAVANAGGQAANLDFDNDGVANGIEYFMNAAPGFTANPGFIGNTVTWPNGGNIPSSAYGTQFSVQTSSDLASWTNVPASDSGLNNAASSLSYGVLGASKQFVRLKVTAD
jgi:hypothetical protein